jgi:hypothetical protein
MRKEGDAFELSASDLVGYLYCRHLSALDRAVAEGALKKPVIWDPLLEIFWKRGLMHALLSGFPAAWTVLPRCRKPSGWRRRIGAEPPREFRR